MNGLVLMIACGICSQITLVRPSTPDVKPAPGATSAPAPTTLSNEELIARLPPAGQEKTRDIKSGSWVSDPISTEWERRLFTGKVTSEQLGSAIRKCAMLRSSPTCFDGEPYHVWMRLPEWLPGQDASAKADLSGSIRAHSGSRLRLGGCGNAMAAQESEESFQSVGVLPKGTTKVVFKLTIEPSKYFDGAKLNWSGDIELPVQIVARAAAKPVDTPALTADVRAVAHVSCSNGFFNDGPSIWLSGWTKRPVGGAFDDTLICLKAELIKGDTVVATQIIQDPDEIYGEERWSHKTTFIHGEIARDIILRKEIEGYTVKVSGVAPTSTNRWYRTRYWSGQFTVPLSDILEPESGMRPARLCGPEGT